MAGWCRTAELNPNERWSANGETSVVPLFEAELKSTVLQSETKQN